VNTTKSRPKTRLDKRMISWQGWQSGNQTFDDDNWDFEVEDVREVLEHRDDYRVKW